MFLQHIQCQRQNLFHSQKLSQKIFLISVTSTVLSDSGTSFLRRSIVLLLLALMLLGMAPYSFYRVKFTMELGYENVDVTPFFYCFLHHRFLTLKSSYNASSAHISSPVQPMVSIPRSWRMFDPFLVGHLGE